MERVIIQNDPSYTTMCKLIKLVSGCESFSMLSLQRSSGKHLSIDMEALIGEPTNQDADQELVLILNQYGLNNLHGFSSDVLKNMKEGRAQLLRQLIDNEDYSINSPQLKYAPPAPSDLPDQNIFGSDTRPKNASSCSQARSSGEPTVYAPGGQSYDPPKQDRKQRSPKMIQDQKAVGSVRVPKHTQPKHDLRHPRRNQCLHLKDDNLLIHHLLKECKKRGERILHMLRTQTLPMSQVNHHNNQSTLARVRKAVVEGEAHSGQEMDIGHNNIPEVVVEEDGRDAIRVDGNTAVNGRSIYYH